MLNSVNEYIKTFKDISNKVNRDVFLNNADQIERNELTSMRITVVGDNFETDEEFVNFRRTKVNNGDYCYTFSFNKILIKLNVVSELNSDVCITKVKIGSLSINCISDDKRNI